MHTNKFALFDCRDLADVSALVTHLRSANIPPAGDGAYHVWVSVADLQRLNEDSEFCRLRELGRPDIRRLDPTLPGEIVAFAMGAAIHLGPLPTDAFPVMGGRIHSAIEALKLSWGETVGTVRLARSTRVG